MLRRFFANIFARRFAVQSVLLAAMLIVLVNEYTHRTSLLHLRAGIALTDDRINAGRLLQALTDAEAGQRSYLLTQDTAFLAEYQKAVDVIPQLRAGVVPFLEVHSPLTASQINQVIDERLSEMATTINLAQQGEMPLALDIVNAGAGSQWMTKIRQMMNDEMKGADQRQATVRVTLFDALAINHAAVIFLTLSSVVALIVFIRQLRVHARERQATQTRLEEAVEKRTLELRDLAQHLQTVRETEKDHLARELHDQLGALLTVAKLDLEGLKKRVEQTPDLLSRIARLAARINDVIVLKRRMVEDMRPSGLAMLGLRTTLEQYCRDMAETMSIPFQVTIADAKLAPETELVIFRFVQEALTNIAKYAQAKSVTVALHQSNDQLEIVIADDGVGFDTSHAQAGQHGLVGMRYRIDALGGTMALTSAPGMGTTLSATVSV